MCEVAETGEGGQVLVRRGTEVWVRQRVSEGECDWEFKTVASAGRGVTQSIMEVADRSDKWTEAGERVGEGKEANS